MQVKSERALTGAISRSGVVCGGCWIGRNKPPLATASVARTTLDIRDYRRNGQANAPPGNPAGREHAATSPGRRPSSSLRGKVRSWTSHTADRVQTQMKRRSLRARHRRNGAISRRPVGYGAQAELSLRLGSWTLVSAGAWGKAVQTDQCPASSCGRRTFGRYRRRHSVQRQPPADTSIQRIFFSGRPRR